MEITFLNPEYLWLSLGIPLLILLHFYSLKYVKVRAFKFANFEALKRVTGGMVLSRNNNLLILRMIVLGALVLSLAGMIIWWEGNIGAADYVLAIDTSGSMLANDFQPDRLEAAKQAAILFIDNLDSTSSVGIVSFSGEGFIESTLIRDKSELKEIISQIQVSPLHGSAIGSALKTASNLLAESEKSRVIILLTDGRENVASSEELEKIMSILESRQIMVNTIGVATKEGGNLPGVATLSTLDEDTLMRIAKVTGGSYVYSKNNEELQQAYQSFDEPTIGKIPMQTRLPLLLFAVVFLILEWIMVNTRYRTIP